MLSENPDKRPTIPEIENNKWYNSEIATKKEVGLN